MKALIRKDITRPGAQWLEQFSPIPSSIASDCLNRYYGIGGDIRPIFEHIRVVGFALTVQSMSGSNMMGHYALTFAQPGDVLVIDARGGLGNSVWGGVQAAFAIKQGVRGVIVDGAIRDIEDLRRMRFPVYARGTTPAGPHKGWADSINVPIQCGGVPVNPGDLVIGDDDGVSIVPQEHIPAVHAESLRRMAAEAKWLERIEQGKSSLDAVGLRAQFDAMDVQIVEREVT